MIKIFKEIIWEQFALLYMIETNTTLQKFKNNKQINLKKSREMVAEEWLGALWVQLVGSCFWTVILITCGSKPLMCSGRGYYNSDNEKPAENKETHVW